MHNALTFLLADSRFPSGSYAHSLGLEQAVTEGLTDVPAFIAARLRLVAEADARFAVEGLADLGLESRVVAVGDSRSLSKADMPLNDALPSIRVEPDTFKVWVDGDEIVPDPVSVLPLAQRYSLF